MKTWVALVVAYTAFAVLEATWLTMAKPFYAREFAKFAKSGGSLGGSLAVRSVPAAVATYAVLVSTFWFLVLGQGGDSASRRIAKGAAFGLAAYGVYNLTNKATLPGYSWRMVAVDIAWGTALFATVAAVYSVVA